MALHGSLTTMPIADLLSWVRSSGRAGLLTVSRDSRTWELDLGAGQVMAYRGPELQEDLGHIIASSGMLTEEDLRQAYQYQRLHRSSLQQALMDLRFLSLQQLHSCVHDLALESIYDLFVDAPGEFTFSDAPVALLPAAAAADASLERLRLDLDINRLLMEGAQRQDECQNIRVRFPHDQLEVRICQENLGAVDAMGVRERRILASLSAGQSLTDICLELRAPVPAVLRSLAHLADTGLVEVRVLPQEAGAASSGNLRLQQLQAQAQVLRGAGQFDEAVALLEVAVRLQPDAGGVHELLRDLLGEQLRSLYSLMPPVKVPTLVASEAQLRRLNLRPEERFLLDRLGPSLDVGRLIMTSSMSELATLRALRKLLHGGLIALR